MSDSTSDRTPHDRQVDALISEFELAIEQGRPLDLEEFLKPHPEEAADVRKYFKDAGFVHEAFQPFRPEPEETEPVSDSPTGTLTPGTRVRYFGDYEIREELGSGGMGVVYKARQEKLKRLVALKMIKRGQFASEEEVKRFQVEAQAAANLDHPGIVRVIEVGLHQGEHYYAMDFVAGGSLSALYREQPVAARRAAELVKKLAEAMHYAHSQGIVHRDLKPANVLLTTSGAPRITDFGLALRLSSNGDSTGVNMTQTGQVLGTAGYMSPEQAVGKTGTVNTPTDIYSLGAILYALLTSRAPFVGDSPSVTILQVINNEPIPLRALNPSVPRDLETICLKCLEKEPHKRYGTAQLLADDLTRFLENKPVLARPISTVERTVRWCRRNPWAAAALSLVLLVAVVSPFVATQLYRLAADRELARRETSDKAAKLETSLVAERIALNESRWQLYRLRLMRMEQLWREKDWGHLERLLTESVPAVGEKDQRGWEWFFLQSQLERRAWRMYENPDRVVALDWDRQTGKLAVFRTGAVDIWVPKERRLLTSIKVPVEPYGNGLVRWSPDHRHLVVYCGGLKVQVVDTETGAILCTTPPLLPREGDWVSYVDWSPRGDCVAVSISSRRSIQLWRVGPKPELIKSLEEHEGVLPARIHWSPDQASCVTISHDGWALYQNTTDWIPVQKRRLVDAFAHDMAWSPDGTRVAFGNVVVVVNADGAPNKSLADQGALIKNVRWLDNHRLVTANEAQELRIVHVDQQKPDELFRLHSQLTTALAIGPDDQIASAAPGESTKVWSPTDIPTEYIALPGAVLPSHAAACAWHPQSNVLGLVSQLQGTNVGATWAPGASGLENVPLTNGASSVHWDPSSDALVVEITDGTWNCTLGDHLSSLPIDLGTKKALVEIGGYHTVPNPQQGQGWLSVNGRVNRRKLDMGRNLLLRVMTNALGWRGAITGGGERRRRACRWSA